MTSAVWSQSKSLLFNSSRRNLATSLAVNLSSMGSLPDFNSVRIWIERSAVIRKVSWIGNVQVSCQTRMPDIASFNTLPLSPCALLERRNQQSCAIYPQYGALEAKYCPQKVEQSCQ